MPRKRFRLLLIEDNPADAHLVRMAVAEGPYQTEVAVVPDGEKAIDLVRHINGNPLPDVVLLDWNLPRAHGAEVLSFIKAEERWRSVPVVVLTSSTSSDDVEDAYRRGASGYVAKPSDLEPFLRKIQDIEHFWFSVCQLNAGIV